MKKLSCIVLCFSLMLSSQMRAGCWADKGLGLVVPAVAGFLATSEGSGLQRHGVFGALSCLAQPILSGHTKNLTLPCARLRLHSGDSSQEILVPYAIVAYIVGCFIGKYVPQDQALSMILKRFMGNNAVRRSGGCIMPSRCADSMMSADDMPCSMDPMDCLESMDCMDDCDMDCPQ